MIINPYLVQPSGPSYGTLTTAWIAATGETDLTILGALNTLETDLTTYGLTSKMKALYPMVGGTAGKHSYNFMNTAAYQITFNGGWTHSSTGALPSITNAYGDTGFNASSNMTLNSGHISYYSRNQGSLERIDFGVRESTKIFALYIYNSSTQVMFDGYDYSSHRIFGNDTTGVGHFVANIASSTSQKIFRNGTSLVTNTTAQTLTLPNYKFYLNARNDSGTAVQFGNRECAFATIGDGLTDTQAANFYTAVQAFQTTLSRQV
jgi:hypothetical protein